MKSIPIFAMLLVMPLSIHCVQKDSALERAIAQSRKTYASEQKARSQLQKNIELAKQRSLQPTLTVITPSYQIFAPKKTPKVGWWKWLHTLWKKEPKTKKTSVSNSNTNIYDWSPYVYRQRDGISCGLHSIKNGYHVVQFLKSRQLEGDYEALIKSISSPPHTRICKFGYPLKALEKTLPKQKLQEMLLSDNVYKSAQDVFELSKKDITVIASTKNFKSSKFDLGFFTSPEAETLKELKSSVKQKKPIIHIFVLGNMEEMNTAQGMRGTSGHWIALVTEVNKQGQLVFHYVNSFGKDRGDLEYKISVIKEFLLQ